MEFLCLVLWWLRVVCFEDCLNLTGYLLHWLYRREGAPVIKFQIYSTFLNFEYQSPNNSQIIKCGTRYADDILPIKIEFSVSSTQFYAFRIQIFWKHASFAAFHFQIKQVVVAPAKSVGANTFYRWMKKREVKLN